MDIIDYDPMHYSVIFNGIPIDGFAEDDFIQVEKQTETFSDEVDAYGMVRRYRSCDQRATVTMVLMPYSASNKILSGLYNTDLKTPNGAGAGPLLIRDTQGVTVFAGAQAWIMGMPKTTLGKKLGNREWKIRVGKLEAVVG